MNESRHPEPERLSAYLEGELSGDEGRRMRGHLQGCDRCAAVLEELREVVRRAGTLQDRDPERDLWPPVARAIGSGGEAPSAPGGPSPRFRRPLRRFQLTPPQAAAAALALISLSAGAAWMAHPDGPGRSAAVERAPAPEAVGTPASAEVAPEGYAQELAELEASFRRSRDSLDPNTVRVLEKNLDVIDRAIRESRRALEVDPGNRFLEDHLERAYRTKLEYLRQAAGVAEWSS